MANTDYRTTVAASGTATVRLKPSVLLMKVQLRSSEATVEQGLSSLTRKSQETAERLKRLGAVQVVEGAPCLAEQAPKDAMAAARAAAMRLQSRGSRQRQTGRRKDVDLIVTATWPIDSLSAAETLLLVDRLRFEAAEESSRAEPPDELPPWASPEEQVREMVAQMQQVPEEDRAPKFLFISRLPGGQFEQASSAAFAQARDNAERLARAAGMRLGRLASIHAGPGLQVTRTEQLMERQRCMAVLAGCAYDLRDDEMASESPCPTEFTIAVNVTYELIQARS